MKSKEVSSRFKCSKCNVGLLQAVSHKIAFLKTLWHCAGKSGTQNISTVIIPLFY
jgi:hypothetical protein